MRNYRHDGHEFEKAPVELVRDKGSQVCCSP